MSIAILTLAFAIAGTAFAIGANMPTQAQTQPQIPAAQALFNASGGINGATAAAMIANIPANNVLSVAQRNAEFRLFTRPTTTNATINRLADAHWRMVHADATHVTLWAANSHRNHAFGANAANGHLYSGSTLRNTLFATATTSDFNMLTAGWATATRNANIAVQGTDAGGANTNDRLWIPSSAEAGAGGIWGLSAANRSFTAGVASERAWLRDHTNTFQAAQVAQAGRYTFSWGAGTTTCGAGHCGMSNVSVSGGGGTRYTDTPRQVGAIFNVQASAGPCSGFRCGWTGTVSRQATVTSSRPTIPARAAVAAAAATVTPAGAVSTSGTLAANAVTTTANAVRPAIRLPRSVIQSAAVVNVTFNGNSHTHGNPPATITPAPGGAYPASISVPAAFARTGHTLQGFYTTQTGGTRVFNANGSRATGAPNVPAGGTTLWARWAVLNRTVTFDLNGGTLTPAPSNQSIQDTLGRVTNPGNPTRAGYTFTRWENAAVPGTAFAWTTQPVTGNITIRAIWTANTGTVSFSLNGGSGTLPSSFTATTGTGNTWPASITVATDIDLLGHIFIGFGIGQTDGQLVFNSIGQRVASPPALVMPAGGLTLYAQWVPIGGAGSMGLAETVSEAHQLRLTRCNFPNETTWQRFNVALRQAEWALWNLHNLTSGQVAAIAGELRTSMDARS